MPGKGHAFDKRAGILSASGPLSFTSFRLQKPELAGLEGALEMEKKAAAEEPERTATGSGQCVSESAAISNRIDWIHSAIMRCHHERFSYSV